MDEFENKSAEPMLIADLKEPFDDPEWIYELKLDGIRVLLYLDAGSVNIRNKQNKELVPYLPELRNVHECVSCKCILDGELVVIKDGVPSFFDVRKRPLLTNLFKIELAAKSLPASVVVYDILYYRDHLVTDLPIEERKALLSEIVRENERLAVSRYIPEKGIDLFNIAKAKELEGVVAKRLGSKYHIGKRTKDWVKFKLLLDEDYVICGYIFKDNNMTSFILGQYSGTVLVYGGHVTLGASIGKLEPYNPEKSDCPFPSVPPGNENANWLKPEIVCIVQYMPRNDGTKNQRVLKAIRDDKAPMDCQIKEAESDC